MQAVHLRICENDPRATGVFNSELCFAVLSCNTTNSTGKVVAVQCLDILDFERIKVQIVHADKGNGVLANM